MKVIAPGVSSQIPQLYKDGFTILEIQQQLSLSNSYVYAVLGKAGLVRRSSKQKDMTPEILRLYFSGKTVYEVAAELRLGKSTVHRAVVAQNAVRPKKGSTNPNVAIARRKSVIVDGLKLCTKCGERKFPEQFPPSTISLDGHRPRCHSCHEEDSNKWRQTEAGAKYRRMLSRVYSHRVRQATPSWVDRKALKDICMQAVLKQEETGMVYHIDHIIAINGVIVDVEGKRPVSGLNVPWNLQILTAVDNCRKSNKHKE